MLFIQQPESHIIWQMQFGLFFMQNLIENSPLLLFVYQNNHYVHRTPRVVPVEPTAATTQKTTIRKELSLF